MGAVVLTGAGGLLGRELARVLQPAWDVHTYTHTQLDIADAGAVSDAIASVRPAVVINCAAITNVDDCETDPDVAWAVNAEGPGHVARAAAGAGAEVLHVSTDYVFDGKRGRYTETDETNPLQVYGRAKLAGEDLVRTANGRHYVVRTAWIYGPGGKSFPSRVLDLAAEGGEIRAIRDQRSSPTFVTDLAEAVAALVSSGRHGTYHVTNGGSCSYAEFCRHAVRAAGSSTEIVDVDGVDVPRPAPRPGDSSLVSDAWPRAGFDALRPWEEASAAFVEQWSRARLGRTP